MDCRYWNIVSTDCMEADAGGVDYERVGWDEGVLSMQSTVCECATPEKARPSRRRWDRFRCGHSRFRPRSFASCGLRVRERPAWEASPDARCYRSIPCNARRDGEHWTWTG